MSVASSDKDRNGPQPQLNIQIKVYIAIWGSLVHEIGNSIIINFNNWNRQIQFYEPQVNIPSDVLEWRDISPRSLELGVAREVQ